MRTLLVYLKTGQPKSLKDFGPISFQEIGAPEAAA